MPLSAPPVLGVKRKKASTASRRQASAKCRSERLMVVYGNPSSARERRRWEADTTSQVPDSSAPAHDAAVIRPSDGVTFLLLTLLGRPTPVKSPPHATDEFWGNDAH